MATVEIFNSPFLTTATFVFALFLVLFLMERDKAPHDMFFSTVRGIIREKGFAISLLLMLGVLGLNWVELQVEKYVIIPELLTNFLNEKETHLLTAIQQIRSYPLTFFLTYVYVIGFPVLVTANLIFYYNRGERTLLNTLCIAYVLNYLIALPFYLFLPVTEAWAVNDRIHLLIENVYPAYNIGFRALSGIDNNFPSLHTSISVMVALISLRSGYRRFKVVSLALAGAVVFSTMYLGIHWIIDVIAGIALAYITVSIGSALAVRPSRDLAGLLKKGVGFIKSLFPQPDKSAKDNFPF